MTRDEFMDLVYDELNSDPDNNRANRIIEAADEYAADSEPTLSAVELYCKRRCLTVITDEMLAKLIEKRDSIPAEAIPVSWIESRIERFMTMNNAFGGLTANIMLVMLNEWRKE